MKEIKKMIGLHYTIDYHISSDWKVTHITSDGPAVIKNLYV
jgi:hypothetical protein